MFYFRLVIPTRLRTHFPENKREIRRSLKTDSRSQAIIRARLLRSRFDFIFENLDSMSKEKTFETGYITDFDAFGKEFTVDTGDADKDIAYAERKIERSFEQKLKLESIGAKHSDKPTALLISDLAKLFLEIKSKRTKLDDDTIKEYNAAYQNLIYILGDIEVSELTPELMNSFYDDLRKLPSRRNSTPLYKDKTHDQLKLIDIPTDKAISIRTANKTMSRITGLLSHATKQRIINFNPAEAVILEKDEVYSNEKRSAFTTDNLKSIFETPHFHNHDWKKGQGRNEPYRFWLPLIALFTGARLGEICQLKTSDIFQVDNIWIFNITNEFDKATGKKIKKVKNKNSLRKIPISQQLIDIGILKFVTNLKNGALFPELNTKQNGIDAAQKWVNNFLKRCGVHQTYIKTFHSIRHTYITRAINLDIKPIDVGAISGHLSKNDFGEVAEIANTYFGGFDAKKLKNNVVDKIDFDVDIEKIHWK